MPSTLEDQIRDVLKQIRAVMKSLPGKQRKQLDELFGKLAHLYGELYKASPGINWPDILKWP